MNKKDIITLCVFFFICLYLWTLPIQNNKMPFSEGDGAYHFAYGDYMAENDRSMGLNGLPDYIYLWYAGWNPIMGSNALEYPPPYHLGEAITQIVGGARILSPFLFIAITCFLTVFSLYFLIRELYGFWPAVLSSFPLIFGYRDILTYLWGQRPSITAFAFVPLILYVLYKYINSIIEKKENINYFYITIFLLIGVYMIHLRGLILVIPIIFIYILFVWIKEKNINLNLKKNIKHIIFAIIIIGVITLPFLNIYLGVFEKMESAKEERDFSQLLVWFPVIPYVDTGYPASFTSYKNTYGSLWTIPLLILGLIFILIRRNKSDILLLAWFFALYINIHITLLLGQGNGGDSRALIQEAHIFYPLMVVGLFGLISIFKKIKYIKYVLMSVFVLLVIFTSGQQAYNQLDGAYKGPTRITQTQYDAAEWMQKNLPSNAYLFNVDTDIIKDSGWFGLRYPKMRWMQVISERYFLHPKKASRPNDPNATYILVDYTDLIAFGGQQGVGLLQQWENNMSTNSSPIYNKDNIRVYKVG